MTGTTLPSISDEERAELEAISQSELLQRAPSVLRLFQYIVEKYLSGEANQLKEYTIAVDALGKSPGFDPKWNSIVRVETYRLRRKLKLYYETEGLDHTLEVVLDPGQYVPRFRRRLAQAAILPAETGKNGLSEESRSQPVPPAARRLPPFYVLIAIVVLLAFSGVLFLRLHSKRVAASPAPVDVRICTGARYGLFVEQNGEVWLPDRWFHGGVTPA